MCRLIPRFKLCLLTVLVVATPRLQAQDFTITASDESGDPGTSVSVSVSIGNPMPARGFSFGLSYADQFFDLVSVSEGSVAAAANGGTGPDYFFSNINPTGGAGGITACVVSLMAPLQDIPAGTNNEVAIYHFDILSQAPGGISIPLSFTSSLGSPPVAVVIDVGGVSFYPTENDGSIMVDSSGGPAFIRADVTGDGVFNALLEALFLLNAGFAGGDQPPCLAAADADGNRVVNPLTDSLFILNWGFFPGSMMPPAPHPDCGVDPNGVDILGCETPPSGCN